MPRKLKRDVAKLLLPHACRFYKLVEKWAFGPVLKGL
jgi:hypothetical protein